MSDAWFAIAVAILLVPFIYVGRRYLTAFVAAHQRVPGMGDLWPRDMDPETERWRRYRLGIGIPVLIGVAWQLITVIGG